MKKGEQISAGKFVVSVGSFDESEIAIISKSSGKMSKLKHAGSKLKQIKRKFKPWLCSQESFAFSFMTNDLTLDLIKMLKK